MCKGKILLPVTLDTAKEWYNKGGELKDLALQCFNESELSNELPVTWEECLLRYSNTNRTEYIGSNSVIDEIDFELGEFDEDKNLLPIGIGNSLLALCQLLICREVYRNGWKPDWESKVPKYSITYSCNKINKKINIHTAHILTFPSEEARDAFYDNFKDLIEASKELI